MLMWLLQKTYKTTTGNEKYEEARWILILKQDAEVDERENGDDYSKENGVNRIKRVTRRRERKKKEKKIVRIWSIPLISHKCRPILPQANRYYMGISK